MKSEKQQENTSLSQKNPYQFYINNNSLNTKEFHFKTNKINTRKYNWITFIPHSLFLQFVRPANIYFLATSIIQCIRNEVALPYFVEAIQIQKLFQANGSSHPIPLQPS